MKNKHILPVLGLIAFTTFSCTNGGNASKTTGSDNTKKTATASPNMPQNHFEDAKDWFPAGSEPTSYDMGIEKGSGPDGKNAATIKSKTIGIKGFGTYMQQCLPEKYLDKRVKLTANIKSADVKSSAGLWFRVDGERSEMLSFDNMQDRPIKGTTDWKKYEIVLDVPKGAINLAYGVLLDGTGQVWFTNVSFEIVDKKTPITGGNIQKAGLPEPSNLSFDDNK